MMRKSMRRVCATIAVGAITLLGVSSAQAHQEIITKEGVNFDSRDCKTAAGTCSYTAFDDGDLKVHTENDGIAHVIYKVANIDHPFVYPSWTVQDGDACEKARAEVAIIAISETWTWTRVIVRHLNATGVGNCRLVRVGVIYHHG
jgi:hypothetical protein